MTNLGNGIFNQAAHYYNVYETNGDPCSVVVKDLNNDGSPDLAIGNMGTTNLIIRTNLGNGTFSSAINYVAGSDPRWVDVEDVNNDQKPDLLVLNYYGLLGGDQTGKASVLTNIDDGTFSAPTHYSLNEYNLWAGAVKDINGDTKPDWVIGVQAVHTINILTNIANGIFMIADTYPSSGGGVHSLILEDINGDGYPDITCATMINVAVLMNEGSGSFTAPVFYATPGSNPGAVAIGELNGDGKPDMAVANITDNSVSIFTNIGNGSFAPALQCSVGSAPCFITLGDVNGDNKLDITTANSGSDNVSVLVNQTSFLPQQFVLNLSDYTPARDESITATLKVIDSVSQDVITNFTNTVHFSSSDMTAQLPEDYTFTLADVGQKIFTNIIFHTAGYLLLTVSDTKTNTGSYTVYLTIQKDNPLLQWSNPSPITYGIPLTTNQLNATANITGVFVYTPPMWSVLNAGSNQDLTVTLFPNDHTNYNNVSTTVKLNFLKAPQTLTFDPVPSKFVDDPPFRLNAWVSSGMRVGFTNLSGPAAILDDYQMSLTGTGIVSVQAIQLGNSNYLAAELVTRTFVVLDYPIEEVTTYHFGDFTGDGFADILTFNKGKVKGLKLLDIVRNGLEAVRSPISIPPKARLLAANRINATYYLIFQSGKIILISTYSVTNTLHKIGDFPTVFPLKPAGKVKASGNINRDGVLDLITVKGRNVFALYGPTFSTLSKIDIPLSRNKLPGKIVGMYSFNGVDWVLSFQKGKTPPNSFVINVISNVTIVNTGPVFTTLEKIRGMSEAPIEQNLRTIRMGEFIFEKNKTNQVGKVIGPR